MKTKLTFKNKGRLLTILVTVPILLWANSDGPDQHSEGGPGGPTVACAQSSCHVGTAVNAGGGKVELQFPDGLTYTPGQKQRIKVVITDATARVYGYQLSARLASNETRGQAGTFSTAGTNQLILCQDGRARAASGTCPTANPLEFFEHSRPSTSNTIEFDWTPPATAAGNVRFYVAGNAANSDGRNTGDKIYTTSITLKAEGACNLTKKPTVRTIGNAASFAREISPNAMASVFGLDFEVAGRTRAASTGDFVNGAFPQQLACVAVEVAGRRAPITYVQTDQVNFQVPAGTPSGSVPVTLILNPGRQNEVKGDVATVTVNTHSPAFFTFNGRSIAAQTSDFKTIADPAVVPGGVAARRGDVVIVYGTGFGLGEPVYQAGEIVSGPTPLRDRVTITVGGTMLAAADVLYAGLAPGNISGLQQFNIRIPQSAAVGNVPITITVGGVSTATAGAMIPVQ